MASEENGEVLDVQVLGPLVIVRSGQRLDVGGPKPSLLVAILVANANEVVSVDSLIGGLWGEEPPVTAKKAVQVNVSLARKSLGPDVRLLTEGRGYLLDATNLIIDERQFSNGVETADENPVTANLDPLVSTAPAIATGRSVQSRVVGRSGSGLAAYRLADLILATCS